MHNSSNSSGFDIDLAAIRRFYFYIVALISLTAALFAIDGLLDILSDAWLNSAGVGVGAIGYRRDIIARNGSILLVASAVFLLHWTYIQQRLNDATERHAALRKLFLYGGLAVAIGFAAVQGGRLLSGAAFLALGGPENRSDILSGGWLHLLLMSGVGLGLSFFLQRTLLADGDYGRETTRAGTVRRLFQTILGLAGLIGLIFGSAQALRIVWEILLNLTDPGLNIGWSQGQLSGGLTAAIIGGLILRLNERRWQATIRANQSEAGTALRRFFLYFAVVLSALAVLAPAAFLLREALLILFFGEDGGTLGDLLRRMGEPLSFIPAGLISWFWYQRTLVREAEAYGVSREAFIIRRVYHYAVAAVALALLWFGLVEILSAGLDVLFTRSGSAVGRFWIRPLVTGLSLLAVSVPVWTQHWRTVQQAARQDDAAGHAERTSLPRRLYLYGVALAGAVLILVNLSQVFYRLFQLLLDVTGVGFFTFEGVNELARGLVALALWLAHVMAIRADGRSEERYRLNNQAASEPEQPEHAAAPLPHPPAERRILEERIAALEKELSAARRQLAEMTRVKNA